MPAVQRSTRYLALKEPSKTSTDALVEIVSHAARDLERPAFKAEANALLGEVKKRTPIDEGFLTADVSNKTVAYKKSFAAVVYVPSNATSSKYAIPMHEHRYNLGRKSIQKQRKVGKLVGRKYITRALWDNTKSIKAIIASEVKL